MAVEAVNTGGATECRAGAAQGTSWGDCGGDDDAETAQSGGIPNWYEVVDADGCGGGDGADVAFVHAGVGDGEGGDLISDDDAETA